jgi:hypothetical protein
MDPVAIIGCLFKEPLRQTIRIDVSTKAVSILDVIRAINGQMSNDAAKTFKRIELKARWDSVSINNEGRPTPVADATTLLALIWAIPGKKAKVFRSTMFQRMKQLTFDGKPYDFGHLQFSGVTFDNPTNRRDVLMIGTMKCPVPFKDDLPEVKEQFVRLTTKAEDVYVQEQQKLSDLRVFRDVCANGTAVFEDQHELMATIASVAKLVRDGNAKPHRASVQSRERAIKANPCALSTCELPHVYIISQRGTSMYKIGFSEQPFKRLACLQTANPIKLDMVKVYHGTRRDEQFLHRVYRQHQTSASNEWFAFKDGECYLI